MSPENTYFVNLPHNKTQGFCEPPEGDTDHSRVVEIKECAACPVLLCHMFVAIFNETGKVIGKLFVTHDPEYPINTYRAVVDNSGKQPPKEITKFE